MASQPNLAERGMAAGLRALNWLAASDLLDRLGIRESTERFVAGASKGTAATAALPEPMKGSTTRSSRYV